MANIILDSRKLKAFENLKFLVKDKGLPEEFANTLWSELLIKPDLYEEFLYFLDNHSLKDSVSVQGYSISDVFVYMMANSNILNDIGKNTAYCDKELMVLYSFMGMAQLMNDPEGYIKKMNEGKGLDRL